MLVIVSDLHFTDGSSGETIREGAFKVFRQRLSDLAYDASWRLRTKRLRNGKEENVYVYEPIREFDIILLGDILDVIRSKRWGFGKNAVRPWDYGKSAVDTKRVAATVCAITNDILAANRASLGVLAGLSQPPAITLPPAKGGKPHPDVGWAPEADGRTPVTVRLHYMVGNHDWFYHLPDAAFVPIRRAITRAMGLANKPKNPFPHDPEESPTISKVLANHAVFARHGDIYDSFNFDDDRDASSLGDVIVIELLNRFPAAVNAQRKKQLKGLPPEVVDGLREIDNVRPLLLVPVWIDGLLRRLCADHKQIAQVKAVWNQLVTGFFKIEFVKSRDSILNPWDNVDKLEAALRFSRGVSLHTASRLLAWINDRGFKKPDSYHEEALTEPNFKNRTARYVVYGHTHHHEIVPLDVCYTRQGELNQLYLNAGTWRRVHRLARLNTKDEEFIDYNVMTYLAFFRGDERCGRPFEAWSGALAPIPA